MWIDEMKADPSVKPVLVVLSDGDTTSGLRFDEVDDLILGLHIPVFSVGFEADLDELGRLSSLVEAASLDASEENVEFKIAALFNAGGYGNVKALAIWIAIVGVVFGAFAFATALLRDTTRVFVVVDSSFQMTAVWSEVPHELDEIDDPEHAEFALATEKNGIRGWQSSLILSGVDPFAPCTFDKISAHSEVAEADELILITAGSSCDTSQLSDWRIIELAP